MIAEFIAGALGLALVFGAWLFLFLVLCAFLPDAYDRIKDFRKKMRGEE